MAERNEIGKDGETMAVEYLKKRGYEIVETNWRWHHFELDIIATDGEFLIVVEVKARDEDFLLDPAAAIDRKKIIRIVKASDAYARLNSVTLPIRFDIVAIINKGKGKGKEIDHIEDAFFAPCNC